MLKCIFNIAGSVSPRTIRHNAKECVGDLHNHKRIKGGYKTSGLLVAFSFVLASNAAKVLVFKGNLVH